MRFPHSADAGCRDGLFAFLSEAVIVAILRRITEHFGSVWCVQRLRYRRSAECRRRQGLSDEEADGSMLATQWDFRGFRTHIILRLGIQPDANRGGQPWEADLSLFPPLAPRPYGRALPGH
jgi:hypothetical protein